MVDRAEARAAMEGELPEWAKRALGAEGYARVEAAIESAERHTSGEIVPVLVRRSSTVGHVPILAFALCLIALLASGAPSWGPGLAGPAVVWAAGCWLAAALAGGWLARIDAVQRLLTPKFDRFRQVDLRAQVEFYELGLSETEARTGVLLLVSLMEHRAVVLADRGIAERLAPESWQEIIDGLVADVKGGELAEGYARAIGRCGELLAEHFPIAEGDRNELRDHLVVKD